MMNSLLASVSYAAMGAGAPSVIFPAITLDYIDGQYTSSGNADLTLNLDTPATGSYILVVAGQESGTHTTPAAPTGTTNWQSLWTAGVGVFEESETIYFEVAEGAGITQITVNLNFTYRVGGALYKITNWDPANATLERVWTDTSDVAITRTYPADTAAIYFGTNRDHPNTGAITVDASMGGADFTGTNNDFYSYAAGQNFTTQTTFNARVSSINDGSRDLGVFLGFIPAPAIHDDAGSHLMWRVNCIDGDVYGFFSINELQLRETIGGADVAGTGTAIATADRNTFEKELAFDGLSGTAWSIIRESLQQHAVGIEFASAKRIQEIVITSRDDSFFNHTPRAFNIEYSDDGILWHIVHQVTGESVWTQNESRTYNGW